MDISDIYLKYIAQFVTIYNNGTSKYLLGRKQFWCFRPTNFELPSVPRKWGNESKTKVLRIINKNSVYICKKIEPDSVTDSADSKIVPRH